MLDSAPHLILALFSELCHNRGMRKFIAVLTGLFIAMPAYTAGLGYNPFDKSSPTSPTGAVKPKPATPSTPALPAPKPASVPAAPSKQDTQSQKTLNTQSKK